MDSGHRRSVDRVVAAALLLVLLCAAPSTVAAQEWDPATTVAAYSAALNAHDLARALALFDKNASATDQFGRHFEGSAGLTEFLRGNGFGSPDARFTTDRLLIVANRAFWTYSCSCADGSTEVRLAMTNQTKISVFVVVASSAPTPAPADIPGVPHWPVGLALVTATLAGWLALRCGAAPAPAPRRREGQLLAALLAALVQTRAHRADGVPRAPGGASADACRVPAVATTEVDPAADGARPWSRDRKHETDQPGSM